MKKNRGLIIAVGLALLSPFLAFAQADQQTFQLCAQKQFEIQGGRIMVDGEVLAENANELFQKFENDQQFRQKVINLAKNNEQFRQYFGQAIQQSGVISSEQMEMFNNNEQFRNQVLDRIENDEQFRNNMIERLRSQMQNQQQL